MQTGEEQRPARVENLPEGSRLGWSKQGAAA